MRPFLLDPRIQGGGGVHHSPQPSLILREGARGVQGDLDHYIPPSFLPIQSLKLAILASVVLSEPTLFRESTGNPFLRRMYQALLGEDASWRHAAISPEQFSRIREQVLSGRSISQALESLSLRGEAFGFSPDFIRALDDSNIDRETLIRLAMGEVRQLGAVSSTASESRRALALFSVLQASTRDPNTLENLIPETRAYLGGEERLSQLCRQIEDPSHWAILAMGMGAAEIAGELSAAYLADHFIVRGLAGAAAFPIPGVVLRGDSYREGVVAGIPFVMTGPAGRAIASPLVRRLGENTAAAMATEFAAGSGMIAATNAFVLRPNNRGTFSQELLLGLGMEAQGRMGSGIWRSSLPLTEVISSSPRTRQVLALGGLGLIALFSEHPQEALGMMGMAAPLLGMAAVGVSSPYAIQRAPVLSELERDFNIPVEYEMPMEIPSGMLWVPPGRVQMGDTESEWDRMGDRQNDLAWPYPNELSYAAGADPQANRVVEMSEGFWLGRTPVTNEEFARYVADAQLKSLGLFLNLPNGDVILVGRGRDTPVSVDTPVQSQGELGRLKAIFDADPVQDRARIADHRRTLRDVLEGDIDIVAWMRSHLLGNVTFGDPRLESLREYLEIAPVVPGYLPSTAGFDAPTQPVVKVTWYHAMGYADWLYPLRGTLSTEAQYERAARGDPLSDGTWRVYATSTGFLMDVWSRVGRRGSSAAPAATAPVDRTNIPRGPFGHIDLTGNVSEWGRNWFGETFYQSMPERDPVGIANPAGKETIELLGRRAFRGGNWRDDSRSRLRLAYRSAFIPSLSLDILGFRVLVSLD